MEQFSLCDRWTLTVVRGSVDGGRGLKGLERGVGIRAISFCASG